MPEINNHINQNPIMANNQDISDGNINISNINNTDTDHNITINDNSNNGTSLINNETANTNSNIESSTNQNITIKIKNTLYHGIYTSFSSDCNNSKYSRFIALAKIKNIKNNCNLQNEHQNSEKNKKELDDKFTMLNDKFSFDGFYQVCDSTGKSSNLSNNNCNKISDLKKNNPNQCNFVSYQIILIKGTEFKEFINNFILKYKMNNYYEKYHYLVSIFNKIMTHSKYLKNLKKDCFGNLDQEEMKLLFNLFNQDTSRFNHNLGSDNYESFPSYKNIFCNISDFKYASSDMPYNNTKYKFNSYKETIKLDICKKYNARTLSWIPDTSFINSYKVKTFIITHNIPFTNIKYDLLQNLLQSNNEKFDSLYPNGTIIFDSYGSANFSELPFLPIIKSWPYDTNMVAKHKWNTLNSYILSKQIRKHFHFKFNIETYNENSFNNITQMFHKENIKIIKFNVSVYMENDIYDDIIHERKLINKRYLQILGYHEDYYNFLKSPLKIFNIDKILASFDENSKTPMIDINCLSHENNNENSENKLSCLSKLQIQPLPYQKKNIIWMKQHESNILNQKLKFKFLKKPDFYYFNFKDENFIVKTYYQNISSPNSDGNLCLVSRRKMISTYKDYLRFNGGILSDQVGLGKTLSCISHIVNQLDFDSKDFINDNNELIEKDFDANTLIVLPPRLIDQWIFEIKKYVNPDTLSKIKIKKVTSINDIGKMSGTDFKKYHIYFISVNLLGNKKYFRMLDSRRHQFVNLKLGKNNIYDIESEINMNLLFDKSYFPNKNDIDKITQVEVRKRLKENYFQPFNIFTLKWNRIFIDEFHESLIGNIEVPRLCSVHESGLSSHNYDIKFDYFKNCNIITKSIPLAKRNICDNLISIKGNFKWLISATPFESNLINLYYIMKFFNTNKFMNRNQYKIDPFNNNIFSMKEKEINKFMKHFIIKTTKKDIIGQVDVPLFNETVTYLKQTEVERRIYLYHQNNSITYSSNNSNTSNTNTSSNNNNNNNNTSNSNNNNTSNNNTSNNNTTNSSSADNSSQNINYKGMRESNILKLFKLCTHIMVAEDDSLEENINNQRILSLSEITKIMVKRYKIKCEKLKQDNIKAAQLHSKYSQNINKINYIYDDLKNKISSFLDESSENYISSSNKVKITQFISFQKHKKLQECLLMLINEEPSLYFGVDDNYLNYKDILSNFFNTWSETYYIFNNTEFLYLVFLVSKKVKDKILKDKESYETKYNRFNMEIKRLENQIKMFQEGDIIKKNIQDPCVICLGDYNDKEENLQVAVTVCRHFMCNQCIANIFKNKKSAACPMCRYPLSKKDYYIADVESIQKGNLLNKDQEKKEIVKPQQKTQHDINIEKFGSKLTYLIEYLQEVLQNPNHRVIVFSQYKKMLEMIGYILDEFKIKKIYLKGNVYVVSKNIQKFKTDESNRVIMLSSETCSSGNNLTEATHIIFADVMNATPERTKDIETQAIGRAVRLGQKKPVIIKRLIMEDTIESSYYQKNKYDMKDLQFQQTDS
tara:strand:+ start:936 stop:5474 length:4539 start_codon:yes stop_codon:yes gene_type:complete